MPGRAGAALTKPGRASTARWYRSGKREAPGTFLGERYKRIRRRRGKQKALIAIARTILEIAYLLISDPSQRFHDLSADYYDTLSPERQTRNKIRDLERLNPGMKVTLSPIGTPTA